MTRGFVPWEAFKDRLTLREAIDRLFEESFVPEPFTRPSRTGERTCRLPVDAYSTDQELVVKASLPGVDKDAVDISLDGDTLTVRARVRPEEQHSFLIRERPCGNFVRTLNLNVPVQADKIEAEFKDGVLTVTIPKAE